LCHVFNRMVEALESPNQGLSQLRSAANYNLADDFLKITPMATVQQLKDVADVSFYTLMLLVLY